MDIRQLHPWNVSAAEARRIQHQLAAQVQLQDRLALDEIEYVAGVDNSYSGRGPDSTAYAAVVVLRFQTMEVVEVAYGQHPVTFPYVPGLLSFREAPAIIEAFSQLKTTPDVVLFDGQGIAHFRRLGIASHLGVLLAIPTIGCAKSRLTGTYVEPGNEFGDFSLLEVNGEPVGAVVRTRPGHSPLFVSPGTLVSIPTAVAIVLACCRDCHFMPEPTRLAHNLVTSYKEERRANRV